MPHRPTKLTTSRGKTARSVVVTAVSQSWRVLASVISAVILGRILLPTDFGLIATAAPILGFVAMLQNLGFSQAIIQRDEINEGQTNALFWLSVILSFVLGLAVFVLAPVFSWFFAESRLADIIRVCAGLVVLTSISAQPVALLNRHLKFGDLAKIDIVSVTLATALSVVVAYMTHSYWSLLIPQAVTSLVTFLGASWVSGWRPGRPVFDKGVKEMASFGAGVSLHNILNFFSRNADNLLIAKWYGPGPLGLYDRAYKLMLFPLTQATTPLGNVLIPTLSRLNHHAEEYRRTYLDAVTLLMIGIQPGVLCAVVYSQSAVLTLLGHRWGEAGPIFAWLGIAGLHQIFTATLGWLFVSQGRAKDFAIVGAYGSVTTVSSFIIGLPWGPLGVAISYTLSEYFVRFPITWWIAGKSGPVHWRDIYQTTIPHALGLLIATAMLEGLKQLIPHPGLIELGALACLSYIVCILVALCFAPKRVLAKAILDKANHIIAKRSQAK